MKCGVFRTTSYSQKPCKNAYQEENDWFIDIKDLNDLKQLMEETTMDLVVSIDEDSLLIEIYDDYRE